MPEPRFDVLGIGNAIVDVIARAEEDLLVRNALVKGSMRLVDTAEAERLYDQMSAAIETSGGCAGNTAAGVASFGGRAAFIGKVAEDQLGAIYRHDMKGTGVAFDTAPLREGAPTARSMILITPDGERTMNTYLGAAHELSPADIDRDTVAAAAITYLEGYLWDPPPAKEAFRRAAEYAHAAGRRVSLTLSDSFCVDRFRNEFLGLIRDGLVDILFANEAEMHALYETSDFDTAVAALQRDCRLAAVTMGANGALVVASDGIERVPATPVETVVDTTGAGDLFAAGFLFGEARGMPHADCARLGALAAAEVISHIGPRPATSLRGLAEQAGFRLEALTRA
jgi:sugar/nucleoside kinase (ribokinase family)